MALPLKPGLTPPEVAFLCEMELVNIVPEERLNSLDLLGGKTPAFRPPFTSQVPLWLALLLQKQHKAQLVPPHWLSPASLTAILDLELDELTAGFSRGQELPPPSLDTAATYPGTSAGLSSQLDSEISTGTADDQQTAVDLTPPFVGGATRSDDKLPYHWLELATLILAHSQLPDADLIRRLIRDIREARAAKIRRGTKVLDAGAGVKMNGVGAMEVAEARGFITGVVDGLRGIGASREAARKEGEERGGDEQESDEDDDGL